MQTSFVVQVSSPNEGVDRGDQLRGYYTCRTKSREFYKYIFLFDVAVTNAYVLQKNFCPENVHKNLKEFQLQLARELIGDYCNRRRAGRRVVTKTRDGTGQRRDVPSRPGY